MTLVPSACYALASVQPDTWIVVVNWNGARLLPGCLDALSRLTRPAHVLVVDNGSSDDSREVVSGYPGVEWLPMGRNLGFAEANNVGMRRALEAGADWVGIVNTDVQLDPRWLEALVDAAGPRPEVGILGGLLLFADDPTRVNSTGLVLDAFGRAKDRDFGLPVAALTTHDGPVTAMTGGAALFRAEALRRVGLFDPAYFAYCEDVDLSLRAASRGVRCWYVSAARALHGYQKSFGSGTPRQRYLLARNHLRVLATHAPLLRAVAVGVAFTVSRAALKAPLELLRGRPAHALAHLRGAGAGALAGVEVLGRRLRGSGEVPRGAEAAGETR